MIALAPEVTIRSKKESYSNGITVCPVSWLLVPSRDVVKERRIAVGRPPPPSSCISRIPNRGDEKKLLKDPDTPACTQRAHVFGSTFPTIRLKSDESPLPMAPIANSGPENESTIV